MAATKGVKKGVVVKTAIAVAADNFATVPPMFEEYQLVHKQAEPFCKPVRISVEFIDSRAFIVVKLNLKKAEAINMNVNQYISALQGLIADCSQDPYSLHFSTCFSIITIRAVVSTMHLSKIIEQADLLHNKIGIGLEHSF